MTPAPAEERREVDAASTGAKLDDRLD